MHRSTRGGQYTVPSRARNQAQQPSMRMLLAMDGQDMHCRIAHQNHYCGTETGMAPPSQARARQCTAHEWHGPTIGRKAPAATRQNRIGHEAEWRRGMSCSPHHPRPQKHCIAARLLIKGWAPISKHTTQSTQKLFAALMRIVNPPSPQPPPTFKHRPVRPPSAVIHSPC